MLYRMAEEISLAGYKFAEVVAVEKLVYDCYGSQRNEASGFIIEPRAVHAGARLEVQAFSMQPFT